MSLGWGCRHAHVHNDKRTDRSDWTNGTDRTVRRTHRGDGADWLDRSHRACGRNWAGWGDRLAGRCRTDGPIRCSGYCLVPLDPLGLLVTQGLAARLEQQGRPDLLGQRGCQVPLVPQGLLVHPGHLVHKGLLARPGLMGLLVPQVLLGWD